LARQILRKCQTIRGRNRHADSADDDRAPIGFSAMGDYATLIRRTSEKKENAVTLARRRFLSFAGGATDVFARLIAQKLSEAQRAFV
jgi:hypothetical protein